MTFFRQKQLIKLKISPQGSESSHGLLRFDPSYRLSESGLPNSVIAEIISSLNIQNFDPSAQLELDMITGNLFMQAALVCFTDHPVRIEISLNRNNYYGKKSYFPKLKINYNIFVDAIKRTLAPFSILRIGKHARNDHKNGFNSTAAIP